MPALATWYGPKLINAVDKNVQDAIKHSIMLMLREVKKAPPCPFDTGRLRGSMSVNWTGSGLDRGEVQQPAKTEDGVGQPKKEWGIFVGVMGTNVEYAPFLEFGTVKMSARPWIRPAFDRHCDFRKYIRKI